RVDVGFAPEVRLRAQALPIRAPVQHLALARPVRLLVLVSTLRDVDDLLITRSGDQADFARPASGAQELDREPLPVGRPRVGLVAVGVRVVAIAWEHDARLAGLEVENLERGAFFEIGDLAAVRREARLEFLGLALDHRGLLEAGSIEEIRLVL